MSLLKFLIPLCCSFESFNWNLAESSSERIFKVEGEGTEQNGELRDVGYVSGTGNIHILRKLQRGT